jgi:hypothetical protein
VSEAAQEQQDIGHEMEEGSESPHLDSLIPACGPSRASAAWCVSKVQPAEVVRFAPQSVSAQVPEP